MSTPITITVGSPPTATILTPADGATFRAGDVISFSGDGTDPDDGALPASGFTWNVDFLHDGHVHPGQVVQGKSGSFTIPTSGHDFSGNTRYRITLTVTDSAGLTDTKSVVVLPQKVNLRLDTAPTGGTIYLDGIAKTTPAVADTLVGFQHTIEVRDQSIGSNDYTFGSWSDGGARLHTITAPATDQSYTATLSRGDVDRHAGVRADASGGGQLGHGHLGRVHQRQHRRQPDRRLRDLEQHGRRLAVGHAAATRMRARARARRGAAAGARRSSMRRTSPAARTP